MKTFFNIKATLLACLIIFTNSCTSDIDKIQNNNDPNINQVLSRGNDLASVLAGSFVSWWQANNIDTYAALAVSGDIATCSWGNAGMRALSNEPRNSIPNTNSWSDRIVLENPWKLNYSAASSASDVIGSINRGTKYIVGGEDKTNSVLAAAYFLRGVSLGYIGLLFDKAYLIDEKTDPAITPNISNYKEMITGALVDLKKCIDLSKSNTFEFKNLINLYTIDNIKMQKLANSYSARFMVQGSRTQAETDAVDWNKVKEFAENGINEDFGPMGDNGTSWWSAMYIFSNTPNGFDESGGRLDMRIVKLADPAQPEFYPTVSSITSSEIATADKRFTTDFAYRSKNEFLPGRGLYHYSHYISIRYSTDSNFSDGLDNKRLVTFAKADNDMLIAEANARLNNLSTAIATINSGTRVTRGNLPAISSSALKSDVLNAIFYERYIELFNTATGGGFFDRRRTNQLQIGTYRHFPIPANTLKVLGLKLYTFGGAKNDPTGMVPHYNIESNPTRTSDASIPTFN